MNHNYYERCKKLEEINTDLYEALKGLTLAYNIDEHSIIVNQDPHYWSQALKALAKVEVK